MTSFVREILSASGKLGEKEDLATKTLRVKKQLEEKKSELRKHMEDRFLDFQSSYGETSSLVMQLETALEKAETLKNTIHNNLKPELRDANQDMDELLGRLQEMSHTVTVATAIKKIYHHVETANDRLDEKKYFEACCFVKDVLEMIAEMSDGQGGDTETELDDDQRKAFEAAKTETMKIMAKLRVVLTEEWEDNVRISVVKQEEGEKMEKIQMYIGVENDPDQLAQLIRSMHILDMLLLRVGALAHDLLANVFGPVLHRVCQVSSNKHELTINLLKSNCRCPSATDVIGNCQKVLEFLLSHFAFSIQDFMEEADTLFSLLGGYCSEKLIASLISDCLRPAVPNTQEELGQFIEVKEKAELLEKYMVETRFIADTNKREISSFSADLEVAFADQRVATILGLAREIMKEDLHLLKVVPSRTKPTDEEFQKDIQEKLGKHLEMPKSIPELEDLSLPDGFSFHDSVFQFPKCQVSKHVYAVIGTVFNVLEEACRSGPYLASRLVAAARIIFDLYCDVLPVYHKDAVERFPQHAAVAFTNCMFLAHECCTLGFEYVTRLPGLSFVDKVTKLRLVGIEIFQGLLQRQREELKTILKESGFIDLKGEAQLPPNTEKAMKQVVLHLQHLRKVWQVVLPPHVFGKSIGALLNFVIGELIHRIVTLEDIAAESAVQISTIFSLVEERAPEVFVVDDDKSSSKHDVVRYVSRWQKFKELIVVLNASLREIEDRWAQGKGPLAAEFSVDEMKQLIRALFQNTDRRARVLASIKYES